MAKYTLHYVTNRGHEGPTRMTPTRYGAKFSDSGSENLRFGKLTVEADKEDVDDLVNEETPVGVGNGEALGALFARRAREGAINIRPYPEKIDETQNEAAQKDPVLGSARMFEEMRKAMTKGRDVVILVHGYSVDWEDAVGTALAFQSVVNRRGIRYTRDPDAPPKDVMVVLFTWPSDGSKLPYVAYRSDRAEAAPSGAALGRALLRLRDYLQRLSADDHCGRNLNLLSHSMGNYVLQHAVARVGDHAGGRRIPCLLDHVFLCAPDIDDDVLEPGKPLSRLPEACNQINVYYNPGDKALIISDITKGNPDRLGSNGAARPGELHHKVHQIDCTAVAAGFVEHSYFMTGRVNEDIRLSLDGMEQLAPGRDRLRGVHPNSWKLL